MSVVMQQAPGHPAGRPGHPGANEFNPGHYAPKPRRLREEGLTDTDRNWSMALHLSPLAALIFQPLIIAPLVVWLIRKDESAFNDDHGREIINFGISFFVLHLILIVTIIGVLLIPVLWIVALVNIIRGAVAASNGEYFRYPMTFRFLS